MKKLFKYYWDKFFNKNVIYCKYIPIYKTYTVDNKKSFMNKIYLERKDNE